MNTTPPIRPALISVLIKVPFILLSVFASVSLVDSVCLVEESLISLVVSEFGVSLFVEVVTGASVSVVYSVNGSDVTALSVVVEGSVYNYIERAVYITPVSWW